MEKRLAQRRSASEGPARLLLTAPGSGAGKTTVTCALLQALSDRGAAPAAFKAGPDYIDPMFHSAVLGLRTGNLDLLLMGEAPVRSALADISADGVAVIEGAMGYYDGAGQYSRGSAWELARATGTPAVLVLDARAQGQTAAAVVLGMVRFRQDSGLGGVILNRIAAGRYPRLRQWIEEETGLRCYGFLPECPGQTLESRHLGLVCPEEIPAVRQKLAALGRTAAQTLDLEGLLALAASAPALEAPTAVPVPGPTGPGIAVARDEAFCFYYRDALSLLERLGARLCFFSPLRDGGLPPGTAGVYLGGGYPELHARRLSENRAMREAIRSAAGEGMPMVAECGGFLYLHETLEDGSGAGYPMAGVIPGRAYPAGRSVRFGYERLTARTEGLLAAPGERLTAHEFHYWESTAPGDGVWARRLGEDGAWSCIWNTERLWAGFPHIHFSGAPRAAARFVAACRQYEEDGNHGTP